MTSDLREKVHAELKRIYWSDNRSQAMTAEMADAVMALLDKRK